MWRLTLTDATMPRDQRADTIGVCGIIICTLTAVSVYIIIDKSDVLYAPYQANADDCMEARTCSKGKSIGYLQP